MSKKLYRYSEESAQFETVDLPFYKKSSFIFSVVAVCIVAGSLLVWGLLPNQESTEHQNDNLATELQDMKNQYELLNKKLDKTKEVLGALEERDNNIYRAYFELEEIPEDVRKTGFGGVNRYKDLERLPYGQLVAETSKKLDILNNRIKLQSKSLDEIVEVAEKKDEIYAHIPAIQPVNNKDLKRMASGFGMRIHPILKIKRMHWGMDFTAKTGTPVYAAGDGIILKSSYMGGYGKTIVVDHGYGYETLYAHLSKQNVVEGQEVKRGEVIGYVGSTGLSSGPHLHYEIKKDGQKVNPISYFYQDLSPTEYQELLEKSEQTSVSMD